jgi:hypothetical protein
MDHALPLIKTFVFKQAIHCNNLIYSVDAGWTMFDWIGSDQGVEELFFGARQSDDFFAHFDILC